MTVAHGTSADAMVSDRTLVRLGRVMAAASVLVMVAAIVVYFVNGEQSRMVDEGGNGPFIAITFFGAVVFAMGLPMVPRNGALWALGASIAFSAINELSSATAVVVAGVYPSEIVDGLSPAVDAETGALVDLAPADLDLVAALAINMGQWLWVFLTFGFFVFFVLLFPDGRLPSRRWRWVAGLVMASAVVTTVQTAWIFRPAATESYKLLQSRIGSTSGSFWDDLLGVWFMMAAVGMVAAIVGMILKWRRSKGETRLQFRWVGFAMIVLVVTNLTGLLGGSNVLIGVVSGGLFMLALGVAITKYRLYDIDIVINRTIVFVLLAVFITVVYAVGVVAVGALVGGSSVWLAMLATAVVAMAFEPVRVWAQRLANRLVYGKRATPYEVLSELSRRLPEAEDEVGLLDRMAEQLALGTGAERTGVWLVEGEVLERAAWYPLSDGDKEALEWSYLPGHVAVIEHDGDRLGALTVELPAGSALHPAELRLVEDLAGSAGLVIRKLRLDAELEETARELESSRRRLLEAQDLERRKLERDLNDGAQQNVLGLKTKLAAAARVAAEEESLRTAELLEQMSGEAQAAVDEIGDLARGIYPPRLESEGLESALRTLADAAPVAVEVVGSVGRYPTELEAAAYFCVSEAVTNAVKHAEPPIRVELKEEPGEFRFTITDRGPGFDPTSIQRGAGLTNMSDRVNALDGSLRIATADSGGAAISGTIPLPIRVEPVGVSSA